MKSAKVKIIIIILSLIFSSCLIKQENTGKDLILVSIYPYEMIAKQLLGDLYEIKSLFPPNTSPHTYSPVPEDIITLNNAKMIFVNGLDLENTFEKTLHELEDKTVTFSDIFSHKLLISSNEHHHHHHHHHHNHNHNHKHEHNHGNLNPHIWTDPEFIVDIARNMAKNIISLNPDFKHQITENLRKLEDEIQLIDSKIKNNRQNVKNPSIIYFHDAFAYFNRRYSINTAALIQAFPGKEPSPSELANLKHIIEKNKVNAIVTEPQFNPKSAEIIANEFKLKIITLDPIGNTTKAKTIAEWLDITQQEIFKGLQ